MIEDKTVTITPMIILFIIEPSLSTAITQTFIESSYLPIPKLEILSNTVHIFSLCCHRCVGGIIGLPHERAPIECDVLVYKPDVFF